MWALDNPKSYAGGGYAGVYNASARINNKLLLAGTNVHLKMYIQFIEGA